MLATYGLQGDDRKRINRTVPIFNTDYEEDVSLIRKYTMTGRPLGSESFVKKLEKQFGERFHALPVGRPSKKK